MATALELLIVRELPGVGESTMTRVLDQIRNRGTSLQSLLRESDEVLLRDYHLPQAAVSRLRASHNQHIGRCRSLRAELDRAGACVLTTDTPSYPRRLRANMNLPPPLLFTLGNNDIGSQPTVSVLGSREIDGHTMAAVSAVASTASNQGFAVVTGGMKSTHRLAAMTSRAASADRLIVLDRGLSTAFASDYNRDPFGCGPLRAPFDRSKTLVLSPFRPDDHAVPGNGQRRDEIIAALGDVVVATSATPGGVTERICWSTLKRGRAVLLWQSNQTLIRGGALRVDVRSLAARLRRFLH